MKEKVFINELEMLEIGSHFFKKKLVHFGTETGFFLLNQDLLIISGGKILVYGLLTPRTPGRLDVFWLGYNYLFK